MSRIKAKELPEAQLDGDKMVAEWLAETYQEDDTKPQLANPLNYPQSPLDTAEKNPFETDSFAECEELLEFFLWNSPATFIQPHSVVREWREIFIKRGAEFAPLVAEIDGFFAPVIKPS